MRLILGSSSSARKAVFNQLSLKYDSMSPDIDESRKENESPQNYVLRLSQEKALAVSKKIYNQSTQDNFLIVASDQVACHENSIFGKPTSIENAKEMLSILSEKKIEYINGLAIFRTDTQQLLSGLSISSVKFKKLTHSLIEKYVEDQSIIHCASGIKIEGLGPFLLEEFESHDPTGIYGMPILLLDKLISQIDLNLFDFCL
jgi:septum formation protein